MHPTSRRTHRAKPACTEQEHPAADRLGGETRELVEDAGRQRPQAFKAGDGYGMFLGKEPRCRQNEQKCTLTLVSSPLSAFVAVGFHFSLLERLFYRDKGLNYSTHRGLLEVFPVLFFVGSLIEGEPSP